MKRPQNVKQQYSVHHVEEHPLRQVGRLREAGAALRARDAARRRAQARREREPAREPRAAPREPERGVAGSGAGAGAAARAHAVAAVHEPSVEREVLLQLLLLNANLWGIVSDYLLSDDLNWNGSSLKWAYQISVLDMQRLFVEWAKYKYVYLCQIE